MNIEECRYCHNMVYGTVIDGLCSECSHILLGEE